MSTKNSKTPQTIVEKVKAFLKLGDDGKLQSFYDRLRKTIQRDVKTLETSRALLVSNFERTSDEFNDKIEDAREAVEAAWMNITPENVATNALQESFMVTYLQGIETAENTLGLIEERFKASVAAHESELEAIDKKIAKGNSRLETLVGTSAE